MIVALAACVIVVDSGLTPPGENPSPLQPGELDTPALIDAV